MAKSRLRHTHDRPPEWLDSPTMRAHFLGGITEAAMYQGGRRSATRTRESAEAENKRRWEMLRKERKTARDQDLEARETREKLEAEEFTWRQGAGARKLANQQKMEEWRAEQQLERQKIEWQRQADAMEELDRFRRDLVEKGIPEDRINVAVRIKRRLLGVPDPKAPAATEYQRFEHGGQQYGFNPSTMEATPLQGVPAEQPDPKEPEAMDTMDVKRYVDMAEKGMREALDHADLLVLDEEKKQLVYERPRTEGEQTAFIEAIVPTIESYYRLDPKLAETLVRLAQQHLPPAKKREVGLVLEALETLEQLRGARGAAAGTAQPQAQPQATAGAPTDPNVLALGQAMGATLTPDQQASVDQASPVQAQAQSAIEQIKARAQAGDKDAQALLTANGIPWQ